MLTDGRGVPLGVAVAGANRPDMKMVDDTLESIPIEQPVPTPEEPQNLCLDAGYDYADVWDTIAAWGYTAHIRPRNEEAHLKAHVPGFRARARFWCKTRENIDAGRKGDHLAKRTGQD